MEYEITTRKKIFLAKLDMMVEIGVGAPTQLKKACPLLEKDFARSIRQRYVKA